MRHRLRDRAAGGQPRAARRAGRRGQLDRPVRHRGRLRAVRRARGSDELADASAAGAGCRWSRSASICTALALALFFALIREVGPQRALVITFVNPAVAVLLGVLLLGEPFTLGIAVGLPLVLVGCVLATRRSPVRTEPSELCDVDSAVP